MGTPRSGEVSSRPVADGSGVRVLLVDGEQSSSTIKELVEAGDSRLTCEIEDIAGDLRQSEAYDVFLVAHHDGASLSTAINELADGASGPVIVITDADREAAERLAMEPGVADCLVLDGLAAETLQRTLRTSVGAWRARRTDRAELRHYQELAAAAYDGSSVAKAIVSLDDGRLLSANAALYDLLGYEKDELVGQHFADITHPRDVDSDVHQFQKLVDGEIDSYTIDKRYIRSDGGIVWGRLTGSVFGGESGRQYALGQVVDITERKEAEDRVAFQAALFQQMRTPVVATDLRGVVTHWNEQAEVAYGWTPEEAIGRDFAAMVLPNIDRAQLARMSKDMRHRGQWEGELTLTRRDGSTFPAWTRGAVVRDGRGRPAGIVGSIADLTEVYKARSEASAQEMLSRSLLEAVSVPIAVLAASGDIVACNPSWGSTVEHQMRRYLPESIELDLESDLLRELATGIDTVLTEGEEGFAFEYPSRSAEGERWTRVVAIPVEQGGAIVCHWDITDERFARAALEETLEAKDEFITSISHELRTPLSVVVGLSETLRMGEYKASEKDEFHDLIADQAQEMALIVEDLLVAGRIDSQTLTVRSTMVDVENEIDAVTRPWDQSGEINLSVRLRPGSEKVYADSLRVRQIIRTC